MNSFTLFSHSVWAGGADGSRPMIFSTLRFGIAKVKMRRDLFRSPVQFRCQLKLIIPFNLRRGWFRPRSHCFAASVHFFSVRLAFSGIGFCRCSAMRIRHIRRTMINSVLSGFRSTTSVPLAAATAGERELSRPQPLPGKQKSFAYLNSPRGHVRPLFMCSF